VGARGCLACRWTERPEGREPVVNT
jgi:hypothetical protein